MKIEMLDYGKHNLLGVQINAVDYEAVIEAIMCAAHERRPLGVAALAVHGVMTGVLDREHCYRLNQLEWVVPDGQPVRWGLKLVHGVSLPDRVYGPTLTLKLCERLAADELSLFLFGGRQATLTRLAERLCAAYPRLRIAGTRPSQFRKLDSGERDQLVQEIRDSGADVTLVGIGCPRQETWAYEYRQRLSMPVLAVGAAFAFHAGELSQAPAWMQASGLEWFYRLLCEPRRLFGRYVLLNPSYVSLLLLQMMRVYTLSPDRGQAPKSEILWG